MARISEAAAWTAPARWLRLAVLLSLVLTLNVRAQEREEEAIVRKVEQALSEGDAAGLLRHASGRIEIAVLGAGTLYSKAQATYVMQEFFRGYPPERFVAGKPTIASESFMVAGRYWYGSEGAFLDLYLRFKWRDAGYEVREIRIEHPVQ